jgi:hypothetical protein
MRFILTTFHLLILITIVIYNPYEGLDYEAINVYEIDVKCEERCINYTEADTSQTPEEKQYQDEEYVEAFRF